MLRAYIFYIVKILFYALIPIVFVTRKVNMTQFMWVNYMFYNYNELKNNDLWLKIMLYTGLKDNVNFLSSSYL